MAQVVPLFALAGATPAEWDHFELVLGAADLLPVVSRPGAVISPGSSLKAIGKTPSIYNGNRQVVGIPKWTQKQSTAAEVARWAKEGDYGICIQTRSVRALDVDVPDLSLACAIAESFVEALGGVELPTRERANTGKQLLAFALPGTLAKRSFKVEGGLVEFLGTGQQFVAVGAHFDGKGQPTGTRYTWAEGLPAVFPVVTQEAFERAWAAIVEEFALEPASEGGAASDRTRADLEGVQDDVVDYLDEQGLVLGSQGEKVFVSCPWKAGHSGDSGITEAAWLVAGTKGFQNGHFQCLHASCTGRTDEDFLDAVGFRASAFEALDGDAAGALSQTPSAEDADPALAPWPKFTRDGKGRIEPNLGNVQLALSRPDICGGLLQFDSFVDTLLINGRQFRDADGVRIRTTLERRGFKPVSREVFRDALLAYQDTVVIDSAQDWLQGLPAWDGVERVETFFPRLFRTNDTPYTRAVGAYCWTALAGRIMEPGCKVDMAIALQGSQGLGKSGGVERIAPMADMFREINMGHMDADLSRKLRGCLVGELAELRGLKTKDAEAIRAWIVQKHERWTPKYLERETSFPRRCLLFATVNPQGFLDDEEGERRWLPMAVTGGRVDWLGIETERDQLYAEGLARWELAGVEWAAAERLARVEHADFKTPDSLSELVDRWLNEPNVAGESVRDVGRCTTLQVAMGALGLEAKSVRRLEELRIGKILRGLGWKPTTVRVDGASKWGWVRDVRDV